MRARVANNKLPSCFVLHTTILLLLLFSKISIMENGNSNKRERDRDGEREGEMPRLKGQRQLIAGQHIRSPRHSTQGQLTRWPSLSVRWTKNYNSNSNNKNRNNNKGKRTRAVKKINSLWLRFSHSGTVLGVGVGIGIGLESSLSFACPFSGVR